MPMSTWNLIHLATAKEGMRKEKTFGEGYISGH